MDHSNRLPDEQLRPVPSHNSQAIGGVVHLRSHSKLHGRKASADLAKTKELEEAEDEDAGLRDERDFKRSQVYCNVHEYD